MAQISESEDIVAYDDRQQLYALNFAANSVATRTGPQDVLENWLESALKVAMLLPLRGWELAWGPKVWKLNETDPGTPPTNAWYVAKKGNRCVLAIAGTAPKSYSGWMQDFDVMHTVRWDKWVSSWPKEGAIPAPVIDRADNSIPTIAHGTAQGVRNILTDKSTKAANGTYVQDFLRQQPAGTEIYVVGHSMGGALAPTVALGLVQSQILAGKNVQVEASAGASPGNTKFAERWASQFSNGNFYNTKDIVAQAWQIEPGQDRCFPNVYNVIFADQNPSIRDEIRTITQELGEKSSKESGVTYAPVRGRPFTSKIPIPKMTDLKKELFAVLHEQHVTAYVQELGLMVLMARYEDVLDDKDEIGRVRPEPESVAGG